MHALKGGLHAGNGCPRLIQGLLQLNRSGLHSKAVVRQGSESLAGVSPVPFAPLPTMARVIRVCGWVGCWRQAIQYVLVV